MKDVPWLSVQPRKVRQQLDGLLTQLKDLPSRLRTYPGYEHVRKLLQSYTKVNILVSELKSDALKDRHWNTIRRDLRVQWVLSDLCLGQVRVFFLNCAPTLLSQITEIRLLLIN